MLVTLPARAKHMVDLAKSGGDHRFSALSGVKATDNQNGTYRLEASDGRLLGVMQGHCSETHLRSAARTLPESDEERQICVIPPAEFKEIFRVKPTRDDFVGLATVKHGKANGIMLSRGMTTLATYDVDGRFPNLDGVLPTSPPLYSIICDAALLRKLLATAEAVCANEHNEHCRVQLCVYQGRGESHLIGVIGRNENSGETFDGILVPLEMAKDVVPTAEDKAELKIAKTEQDAEEE